MKITDLFSGNIFLAPMAGFTDAGFRALAKKYGAALTVTEMVSAKALSMNSRISKELLFTADAEKPVAVQLFGHESEVFARVAKSPEIEKFDIIDINMGCPMKKIVANGDGSALMNDPVTASKLISAARQSGKFVSVKFRLGICDDSKAVGFARMCRDSGADMITVHGRTQKQLYSGAADWQAIAKVVKSVGIPVVANGDVESKADYENCLDVTGAYGVAIGRGALGKPYIFSEIIGAEYEFDILQSIKEHIAVLSCYISQKVVANVMKKHICHYVKGIPGSKTLAAKVCGASETDEMLRYTEDFLNGIKN